jgi:tetratricopeptide (TPR) repeat protein
VARGHLADSLRLYRRAGHKAGQVDAHLTLGWMFACQERYADALSHCEQALGLLQGIGDRAWQARALHLTGRCCAHLGRHQQARASCQQALGLLRELGHRPYEAETWHSLGDAEHHSGDHAAAMACYGRALSLFRELGDRHTQAKVLAHLGDAQQAAGQTQAARKAWHQAVAILDALHHPDAGHVVSEVSKLKQEIDGDIVVYASYQLERTLIEHDLVDELRLFVFPVVVGVGEHLFAGTSDKKPLRLLSTRTVGDSLAYLTYEFARGA